MNSPKSDIVDVEVMFSSVQINYYPSTFNQLIFILRNVDVEGEILDDVYA